MRYHDIPIQSTDGESGCGVSAAGDHLEAVGTVLKSGRTLPVCRLEVFSVRGDDRKLVAAGQRTLISVPTDPGSA